MVDEDREPQREWLEAGPPPSGHVRRRWFAGLTVALLAVAVVAVGHRSLSDSADGGGRNSAPPSTTPANWPRQPFIESPVVPPGPKLPAAGDWIVYGRAGAEVIRLDLGSGGTSRTPAPELDADAALVTFLATSTGVLARPVQPVPGYQVRDGEPAEPLPAALGQGGLVLPGPRPDQVWITSTSRYSTRGEMLLASLTAGWVRVQASLPAETYGSVQQDGAGSYYLRSTGGSYLRVPGGYRRISTGTVLAATVGSWLTAECDQQLRCRHLLVDRRSGKRREVHLVPTFDAEVTLVSLSPDSRYVAVAYRLGTSPVLHLIDLTNGVDHEVAAQFDVSPTDGSLVWSPTGKYLAAVAGQGRLVVVASATAQIVPLEVDLPPISQLAAKPQ